MGLGGFSGLFSELGNLFSGIFGGLSGANGMTGNITHTPRMTDYGFGTINGQNALGKLGTLDPGSVKAGFDLNADKFTGDLSGYKPGSFINNTGLNPLAAKMTAQVPNIQQQGGIQQNGFLGGNLGDWAQLGLGLMQYLDNKKLANRSMDLQEKSLNESLKSAQNARDANWKFNKSFFDMDDKNPLGDQPGEDYDVNK